MGVWAQKEQRSLCIGQSDERGQQYNTVDFHDYRIAKEGSSRDKQKFMYVCVCVSEINNDKGNISNQKWKDVLVNTYVRMTGWQLSIWKIF